MEHTPQHDACAELQAWAESGAMALTGSPTGPPTASPGRPATSTASKLNDLGFKRPGIPAERAAYGHLQRNAPTSCGGAFRVLETTDGQVALSLARRSDIDLVPALIESGPHPSADVWELLAAWAKEITTDEASSRLTLLNLPGGAVHPSPPKDRPAVITTTLGTHQHKPRALIVDLTSLWAGPLCAHLLGLAGHQVVKVESTTRPDGARNGPRAFFDQLHAGHDQLALDFTTDIPTLLDLIERADLVLESSRPRALEQLGINAKEVVANGTSWVSITAEGRNSDAVGFGDDIAVRAGLSTLVDGHLAPVGDALADPLTGVVAAHAAADALNSTSATLVDVSMLHVAAEAAEGEIAEHSVSLHKREWWVESATGRWRVVEPFTRN